MRNCQPESRSRDEGSAARSGNDHKATTARARTRIWMLLSLDCRIFLRHPPRQNRFTYGTTGYRKKRLERGRRIFWRQLTCPAHLAGFPPTLALCSILATFSEGGLPSRGIDEKAPANAGATPSEAFSLAARHAARLA